MLTINRLPLILILQVVLHSTPIYCSNCRDHKMGLDFNLICKISNINDFGEAFDKSNIKKFEPGLIKYELIIKHNITTLTPEMFQGIEKIYSLDLSYNNMSTIEKGTFRYVDVNILNLVNNKIQRIERDAFSGTFALLDLHRNHLKAIPAEAWNAVKELKHLRLTRNRIVNLNINDFSDNIKRTLTDLELSHNNISAVPARMFRNFLVLRQLFLNNNEIQFIGDGAFSENLELLSIADNKLLIIPTDSLKHTNHLLQLYLSRNFIQKIDNDDLRPFGKTIRYLNLANNQISSVGEHSMDILKTIKRLDLRNNSIRWIKPDTFATRLAMDSIFHLSITDNPLQCHRHLLWLKEYALNYSDNILESINTIKCWSQTDQRMYRVIDAPMMETFDTSISSSFHLTVQTNVFTRIMLCVIISIIVHA